MTRQADRTIATSKSRHNALGNAASCRRFGPRAALKACVRGFVVRRVEGAANSEHLSRFPATASCSLSWFLEGSAVRVCDEQSAHARIVFRGPQTRPVVVRHRGPLHLFILLLAADALWWLTGVSVNRHLNRIGPIAAALDDSWQAMALDVLHAPTDEDRVKRIEMFLEPRWRAARSSHRTAPWGPAQRHGEWSRAVVSRARIFSEGRSRRQLERQMRTMTGWSARALKGRVATRASARSNYGGACQRRKICGSTRRGLTGVALATTYYVPLMLTLDAGSPDTYQRNASGRGVN